MNKRKAIFLADMSLILVAIIWGSGFIATEYAFQSNASPTLILAYRFMTAALILFMVFHKDILKMTFSDFKYGFIAGVLLFLAFYTQTVGQVQTVISNAAFITATNVAMVPFIVWGITKKKPELKTFILSFMALCGVGILTLSFKEGGLTLGSGDAMVFLCAILFALHIAYLSIAVKNRNPKVITFIQIATAGLIALVVLLIFDLSSIHIVDYRTGIIPILYLAVFSTCVCYVIQTTAQKYTTPSKTGIILSTEGLFGSLFSVVLGLEGLTYNLIIGGTLILASVILMEIKWNKKCILLD